MGSKPGRIPGPGRPKKKKDYSDEVKHDVLSACQRRAKETGKTLGDILCDMAWEKEKKWGNMKIGAVKTIAEILVTKESHQTIEKHEIGPQIALPPIKQPDKETIYPVKPKEFVN